MVLESNTLDVLFVKDGQQGEDGKILYTWIKYAKDASGTGITDDPNGAIYIGISYNNESSIESNDPTHYAWTKIQGADGKKGEDAYTIFLENENISFATDKNRNPLSEQAYTSGITIMKGAKPVTDFTIGDIAKTQGIAVAKTDTAIAISVVNGNPLPNDNGEIEIPITVGGTVFKKILTWTCAKKGDQGEKGKDGTSVKITSKSVTYQTSTSGTTAPTGTWSTTVPTVNNGQYLWTKTTVQYSDGNKTEAYSVSYKGTNGTNGTSVTVSKTEITYQVSTSGTTAPTGTWSTTMPSCDQGQYLWTKTYVKYSDGKETTSYSVSYKGVDGADGQDGDSFAWNMLSHSSMIGEKIVCQYIEPCNSVTTYQYTDEGYHIVTPSSGNANNGIVIRFDNYKDFGIDDGESISFSCDIKGSTSSKPCIAIRMGDNLWYGNDVVGKSATFTPTNNWQRFSVSTTTPSNLTKRHIWLAIHGNLQSDLYIKNLKLEKGISATPWSPSQSDIEGKGIAQIVQYYLATSQASGVTSSTSGWSTDITTQKLTADKKYLWNCYQTKYSDGTSEPISTPTIIGAYGDKGQNAKSITITPSAQIFKSTDGGNTFAPNQITITPTLQGDITFGKWQYSIDGGVSFADVVSGQSGLSVDANKKLTIAKTSGLFTDKVTMVTFRAVASDSSFYDTCSIAKLYDVTDIEIGGVNLIKNSNFADGVHRWVLTGITYAVETDSTYGHHIKFSSSVVGDSNHRLFAGINDNFNHIEDTTYTLSFYAKASANTQLQTNVACSNNKNNYSLTTSWQRFTFTYKASAAGSLTFWAVEANKDIYLANIKLERGNKPTDYTVSPEDVQTAILSTKSEISDVSLKVDNNKQAIEQRVEKTTYQQDLTLVKGDISKANEGLNKWRYEIYPKSLFASEYQGKSTMDVFAKNTNLTPSQSVLINDTDLSIAWNYDNNYIGYALTFVKFSAAKSVAITFAHDDGAHIYLNGKLVGGNDVYNNKGESLTLGFVKGWNCIEVVVNEGANTEGFKLGTTISALSECQLMNCYYGTPVARQSHITNQLVQNTTDIDGVSGSVQKVMSTVGGSGKIDEFVSNYSTWKKKVDGIETRVGETYTTKSDFNGLEIGGRNLLLGTKDFSNGVYKSTNNFVFSDSINGFTVLKAKLPDGGTYYDPFSQSITYEPNTKYTLSFYAKADSVCKIGSFFYNIASGNGYSDGYTATTLTTYWKRYSITWITGNVTRSANVIPMRLQETGSIWCYMYGLKFEKGSKATDWTPAPEDNEINGQNLVSNLPANWEQGTVTEGSAVGTTYANTKSASAGSVRPKKLIPVSGNITISTAYSNQSKKPIRHWIAAYDVNKNYLGNNYVSNAWNSFPRTLDMKDAKYIAIMVGYTDSSAITPSDISKIFLKIERGTSATPFTLAPEDVNGKIVNVETIATQTATEIGWLINRNGSTASSLKLTENALTAIAENINLTGRVKFSSLSTDAKQGILNSFEVGGRNLALNTSNSYSTAFTSFSGVENTCFGLGQVTCKGIAIGDVVTVHLYIKYTDIVPASGQTARIWTQGSGNITVWNDGGFGGSEHKAISGSGEFEFLYSFTMSSAMYINTYWDCALRTDYIASGSIQYKAFKVEKGNKATDWTPAPEDYLPQANLVSNWTTNTTWIDGGKIYTGSITADKIAANAITANKIATDAIKSRNYISSGGTQGSFLNLSDGSFKSPNLSWDSNGNLIAKNANLSGEINATEGSIGGWNIKDSLYSNTREPYDISKYYAKKILNKPSFTNICMNTNVLSAANYGTVGGDHVTIGDSLIATNTAYSFGVNISLGRISLFGSTYYTSDLASELNKSSSLSLSGDKISFWEYDEDGHEISEQNNTYITSNYARFSGDIFIGGDIGTDGGADIGGKLQASSIAAKNGGLIETAGTIYGGGEIQCGGGQMRIIGGDYGILLRNDGSDFYILSTDSGNQYGYWNSKRPFRINLANGIPYFEYGIIIPNENYLLGNGYQMCRGTSWGGVCIGDDSKGLRFYGTSIWASHSISTSDENLKENFTTLDQYEDFYMNLNPIGFNYIGDYDGKKTHFGFGAHKTEDILESEGYDSEKFAVVTHRPLVQEDIEKRFGKDVDVDIETEYGVSYTEFIALNTHMIQKTRKELETVKQEKADLETRLQAIEAKLGL